MFSCGIGKVQIIYRPGKEDDRDEALSFKPSESMHSWRSGFGCQGDSDCDSEKIL